jgi:hypothetical protein
MTSPQPPLFGIYPLSVAGTPTGLAEGPPDDYNRIHAALEDLGIQGSSRTYLVDTESGWDTPNSILHTNFRPDPSLVKLAPETPKFSFGDLLVYSGLAPRSS